MRYPAIIQGALHRINNPEWKESLCGLFSLVGLNAEEYLACDLAKLKDTDSAKYNALIAGLQRLKGPEMRKRPPEVAYTAIGVTRA